MMPQDDDCKTFQGKTLSVVRNDVRAVIVQAKNFTAAFSVWQMVLGRGKDAGPSQRAGFVDRLCGVISSQCGDNFYGALLTMLRSWKADGVVRPPS